MLEDILYDLGLDPASGEYSKNGQFVVTLYDSDEFGKVFSALEKNSGAEELYDSTIVTTHNASVSYLIGNFQLAIIADFDQDLYKLIITEYEYVEDDEDDGEDYYFEDEDEGEDD